ncbi:MAG: hypothetical protein ACLVKA_10260 [Collinsella aerofaciens]
MSELAIVRTLVPSIAGVGLFIFVVLTAVRASNGDSDMSAAGAFAISAMSPIMAMTSLAGLDNQTDGSAIGQRCPSHAKASSAHATCASLFSRSS